MSQETDTRSFGSTGRIVQACVGVVLIYACGWYVLWNKLRLSFDSMILDDRVVAFRINDGWYGIGSEARFFDSPVLSWLGLLTGFALISLAINPESKRGQ